MHAAEARQVLGVPSDASEEAIRKAYRKAALKTHPDKSDDPEAKRKFQRIAEAYKCLTEPGEDDDGVTMTEEELRREMETMYEAMYDEFCAMCEASGIPPPPPSIARAMMMDTLFSNDDDDLGDDDDDSDHVLYVDDDLFRAAATDDLLAKLAGVDLFPEAREDVSDDDDDDDEEEPARAPLEVGSRVRVRGGMTGTVRFMGTVHYARGDDFVGIELDEPRGKNNGTIKGHAYFACEPKHGTMVKSPDCTVIGIRATAS